MPAVEINSFAPAASDLLYLDTSAVIATALLIAKADGEPVSSPDEADGKRIEQLAARARASQARLVVTVLAFEELAAVARVRYKSQEAAKLGKSWHALTAENSPEVERIGRGARSAALRMVDYAIRGLSALSAFIDEVDTEGIPSTSVAETIRDEWRSLYGSLNIDPMDALHVVVGAAIGSTHYVSLDKAWTQIPNITVVR